jgi:hypothetical protein
VSPVTLVAFRTLVGVKNVAEGAGGGGRVDDVLFFLCTFAVLSLFVP